MEKVLLIIPAYNEEACILNTYQNILKYNHDHNENYEVIVINDGSKDNTAKICSDNNIPHISLIHNLGIGGAVQTGYKYAKANGFKYAVQYDGDGQHDVSYVDDIILPLQQGKCDFVIGSRFIDENTSDFKSSFSRRVGIKLISSAIKLTTGVKIHDTTSGFRAVNKNIIHEFASAYPVEYPEPITTSELLRKGYKMKEIPVRMHERDGGESSIKAWKTIYYMVNVILTIFVIRLRRYPREK